MMMWETEELGLKDFNVFIDQRWIDSIQQYTDMTVYIYLNHSTT